MKICESSTNAWLVEIFVDIILDHLASNACKYEMGRAIYYDTL